MPTRPQQRAEAFKALHIPGDPLVLFNIWDAGSAKAVGEAGARALATGSWSVAAAHGFADGEAIPLELALTNLRRIVAAVELPVSIDLESGYGATASAVGESLAAVIQAGAIGCNLEDPLPGGQGLRAIEDQCARLAAARASAERAGLPLFFLNARTDSFLKTPVEQHDEAMVDAALERARAYAGAGASGLFVPGLADERLIARVCERSPLPVNILVRPHTPPRARLASLGVARISHGPGPYRLMMKALGEAARAAMD